MILKNLVEAELFFLALAKQDQHKKYEVLHLILLQHSTKHLRKSEALKMLGFGFVLDKLILQGKVAEEKLGSTSYLSITPAGIEALKPVYAIFETFKRDYPEYS